MIGSWYIVLLDQAICAVTKLGAIFSLTSQPVYFWLLTTPFSFRFYFICSMTSFHSFMFNKILGFFLGHCLLIIHSYIYHPAYLSGASNIMLTYKVPVISCFTIKVPVIPCLPSQVPVIIHMLTQPGASNNMLTSQVLVIIHLFTSQVLVMSCLPPMCPNCHSYIQCASYGMHAS